MNFKGKTQESIPHKESFSEMKRDEATVSNQNQQNLSSSLPGETTTMKISDVLTKLACLYLLDAFEERDVRTVLDLENVLMDKLLVSSSEVKEEDDREEEEKNREKKTNKSANETTYFLPPPSSSATTNNTYRVTWECGTTNKRHNTFRM